MSWNKDWFSHDKRFKKDYWDNIANQTHFLNSLASEFHLKTVTDWYRVTSSLIKKKGGTVQSAFDFLITKKGFLKKYSNSLLSALNTIYPHENWEGRDLQSDPQVKLISITRSIAHPN